MSRKKNKKKNAPGIIPPVCLSQCMITKNEEKNIEKALSWAKNIAFEQIVVDTGSTDRTIEIAERMGAKILHFEWINDFSAAKNFAIEQASGNWIAFLDADEYFSSIDAKKLMIFLRRIQSDPHMRANFLAINCALVNVDDAGKPASTLDQERVFRNIPSIRYVGSIHEMLSVEKKNLVAVDEIKIIHTGYSDSSFKEAGKAERNVALLRVELNKTPDDLNLKSYLADSLKMCAGDKDRSEADELFMEVINGGDKVNPDLLKKAYLHYIVKTIKNPNEIEDCIELCKKACEAIPDDPDLEKIYTQLRGQ